MSKRSVLSKQSRLQVDSGVRKSREYLSYDVESENMDLKMLRERSKEE